LENLAKKLMPRLPNTNQPISAITVPANDAIKTPSGEKIPWAESNIEGTITDSPNRIDLILPQILDKGAFHAISVLYYLL
jgi:hypothetical protein